MRSAGCKHLVAAGNVAERVRRQNRVEERHGRQWPDRRWDPKVVWAWLKLGRCAIVRARPRWRVLRKAARVWMEAARGSHR
eukprot:39102-Pleurochrysis_carterae.AAC.1